MNYSKLMEIPYYIALFISDPVEGFRKVLYHPVFLTPFIYGIISLVLNVIHVLALVGDVYILEDSTLRPYHTYMVDLVTLLIFRFTVLISYWFVFFVLFWVLLHTFKVEIEGFRVFSAAGFYITLPPLVTYVIISFLYIPLMNSPIIVLYDLKIGVPEYYITAVFSHRLYKIGGALLLTLINSLVWFERLWRVLLSILFFKAADVKDNLRCILGGVIITLVGIVMEISFEIVGLA